MLERMSTSLARLSGLMKEVSTVRETLSLVFNGYS
jgi:hypothetical protein